MIVLLCDHCGIDYSTCTCFAGLPDVLPPKPLHLTDEDDDFELTPIESPLQSICLGCGETVDENDECSCVDLSKEEV